MSVGYKMCEIVLEFVPLLVVVVSVPVIVVVAIVVAIVVRRRRAQIGLAWDAECDVDTSAAMFDVSQRVGWCICAMLNNTLPRTVVFVMIIGACMYNVCMHVVAAWSRLFVQLVDVVNFRKLKSTCGSITHSGDDISGAGDGDVCPL